MVDNVHSVLAIDQTMIDSSVHQGLMIPGISRELSG
jgi:hypothetical protein